MIYAATPNQGVFKSVDAGRNWNAISQGLPPGKGVTSLAIDSADASVLYVGVDAGGVFAMQQVPPTISKIFPASGPLSGDIAVIIEGGNFAPGATVRFGDTPASSVSVLGPSKITVTTPPGAAGSVDVVVTNPDGQSGIVHSGFDYLPSVAPTNTPTSPPVAAENIPMLSGWGFLTLGLLLSGLGYVFLRGASDRL